MHAYDSFNEDLLGALAAVVGEDDVLMVEPMRAHTTFKIGGPADVLVRPHTPEEAVRVLDLLSIGGVPATVVGNGSDLLVGDRGIRGAVVLFRENMAGIQVTGERVVAEAGAPLRDVALAAADAGLSGMEPLWGIPATVGGACHMNAGAYGGQTSDVLESISVYAPGAPGEKGRVVELPAAELAMGYRKSRVHDEGLTVLSATFRLAPDSADAIRAAMDDFRQRREEKQPLEMPSAGSTFKRPEGYFAGKLIMDAGLRGAQVGAAKVSEKHCGFVVNTGSATARDVRALIEHVQDEVRRQFGVELEPEVKQIGEF
ncbi:UDP-N-acetylmuramate dehydrogenase [Collinsella vaginalis]|uniref:UDP-N-acetylmuramate dehydrogenase n=1 Tax=Collinsella vaginalis TaxID=1870987 RepID=UPI000A26C079|nr:UDP-N-acetylmuramate dehydrogenase [Collinsella vaginalis]